MDFEAVRVVKLVVAVSGGVDSTVLLDKLVKAGEHEIIVAHFDHGIRTDSARDAQFVKLLAKKHGLQFETRREELGENTSEEQARNRRYAFLRDVAARHNAIIATAHHIDDVAETIAINLTRGTGWRGLSVLDSDIIRPLISETKREILDYAARNNIEWREDSTNEGDIYLRNRLRRRFAAVNHNDVILQLAALRARQVELKRHIDQEVRLLISGESYSRYFFTHLTASAAYECIRAITRAKLTRPQMERLLLAIKTFKPGAIYSAGNGIQVYFTSRHFSLEVVK